MTGSEFRAALQELDLSQRQFALKSGSAVSTVNRWCAGTQPIPGWVTWVIRMLRASINYEIWYIFKEADGSPNMRRVVTLNDKDGSSD